MPDGRLMLLFEFLYSREVLGVDVQKHRGISSK